MDYSRLVEKGVYLEHDLKDDEKAYVNGMRKAIEYIDDCLADLEIDEESILQNIKKEIVKDFVDGLKLYIKASIDEFIVCVQEARSE